MNGNHPDLRSKWPIALHRQRERDLDFVAPMDVNIDFGLDDRARSCLEKLARRLKRSSQRNAIRNWKPFLLYLVRIFASDISLAAVENALRGKYAESIDADVRNVHDTADALDSIPSENWFPTPGKCGRQGSCRKMR